MGSNKEAKCIYDKCMLPYDNKKYMWQFFFLLVGFLALIIDTNLFTFTAILLYTVPVLIDLLAFEIEDKPIRIIRGLAIAFNVVFALFCLAGFIGAIRDNGDTFSTSVFILPQQLVFSKSTCGYFLILNAFVPFVFWKSSPCIKNMKVSKRISKVLASSKT